MRDHTFPARSFMNRSSNAVAYLELLESRRLLSVDMLHDAAGLSAANSVTVDGVAYFFANDGQRGREFWKSDGTAAGTTLVKDLTPGAGSSELHSIFQGADDRVVFVTILRKPTLSNGRNNDDYTLWSSDGSGQGTIKLAHFTGVAIFKAKQ